MRTMFALLLVVMVGCGPSAAQIKEAREATYPVDVRRAHAYALDVVEAEHGVMDEGFRDDGVGVIVAPGRWYSPTGVARQSKVGDTVGVYDGDVLVRMVVLISPIDGGVEVDVVPSGERFISGHSTTDELGPDDPRMPGFARGQADDLIVKLHAKLRTLTP